MERFFDLTSRPWKFLPFFHPESGSFGVIPIQSLELLARFFSGVWNLADEFFPTIEQPTVFDFCPSPLKRSGGAKSESGWRWVLVAVFSCGSSPLPPLQRGHTSPERRSRPFGAKGAEGRAGSRRRNDDAPRATPATSFRFTQEIAKASGEELRTGAEPEADGVRPGRDALRRSGTEGIGFVGRRQYAATEWPDLRLQGAVRTRVAGDRVHKPHVMRC